MLACVVDVHHAEAARGEVAAGVEEMMRGRTLAVDAGRTYANLRRSAAVAAEVGPP